MIVDGKLVSAGLKNKVQQSMLSSGPKKVCFIIFGNDPGSKQYITMKKRFAESLGMSATVLEYSDALTPEEIKQNVLNAVEEKYDGIVVQLPLPSSVNTQEVLDLVPPEMDIDVLSTISKELYRNNKLNKVPPVARAVLEILNFYSVDLNNKEILVIGSGKLVGEPVGNMLNSKNIPYKKMSKDTPEEEQRVLLRSANIIISGAGSPYFIKPEMINAGVVLIDAGTSEQNGKVVGDADPSCAEVASLITPVPNGVGPVTMACLFLNI